MLVDNAIGGGPSGAVPMFQGGQFGHGSFLRNPGLRRPYWPDKGRNEGYPCVNHFTGRWTVEKGVRVPIKEQVRVIDLLRKGFVDPIFLTANTTSLRKEAYIELDKKVQMAARQRLKAWEDLAAASPYGGFNAMSKMTLEYEAMSDPGEAIVDMDALGDGRQDYPLFDLRSLPLPITHSDFSYSQRLLDVSAGSGTPLDGASAEAASRRVAEAVEKTLIGTQTGISYGYQSTGRTAHNSTIKSTVYGYTNFPYRNTKTNFTAPTGGGWDPDDTVNEVLAAISQLYDDKHYGPFVIYHSTDWSQYMNRTYSYAGGNNQGQTLRDVLLRIEDVQDVRRLDFLTSTFTLLIVQMTSEVCQAVNGLGLTTVQWPTVGGLQQNWKVMVIWVPLLRADYSGNCGILHGTTA